MEDSKNSPSAGRVPEPTPLRTTASPRRQTVYDPPSLVEPSAMPAATEELAPAAASPPALPVTGTPPPMPPEVHERSIGFYKADVGLSNSIEGSLLEERKLRDNPTDSIRWISAGDSLPAHSSGWLMKMIAAALISAGLVFLITRDVVPSVSVLVAGVLFGILGARKPHPLTYELNERGITVGTRHYPYTSFRAFSVLEESNSVALSPLQRFAPLMYVHLEGINGRAVIDALSAHLPVEAPRHDAVDTFVNRFKI